MQESQLLCVMKWVGSVPENGKDRGLRQENYCGKNPNLIEKCGFLYCFIVKCLICGPILSIWTAASFPTQWIHSIPFQRSAASTELDRKKPDSLIDASSHPLAAADVMNCLHLQWRCLSYSKDIWSHSIPLYNKHSGWGSSVQVLWVYVEARTLKGEVDKPIIFHVDSTMVLPLRWILDNFG